MADADELLRGRIRPLPGITNDELPLLPPREHRAVERSNLRLG
jgi:hypothetical protein